MTVQLDVELNNQWRDDIAELKTEFETLDGKSARLDVDTRGAIKDVSLLQEEIDALTQRDHTVDIETNVDKEAIEDLNDLEFNDVDIDIDDDAIANLNNLEVDDVDVEVGEIGDLEGLNDVDDVDVSITSEIADDDPLISALTDDNTRLSTEGVVHWESRGGHPPDSDSSGTVYWDSELHTVELIEELKKARRGAESAGANKITWEIETQTDSKLLEKLQNDEQLSEGAKIYWYSETESPNTYKEGTIHWESSFNKRDFKHGLANLKKETRSSGLNKLDVKVCVERCDDWKQNLQEIHKDLDPIKSFGENDDGVIEVDIVGNLDEIEGTIDQLDEAGFEPSEGGGNDSDTHLPDGMLEGMVEKANAEIEPSDIAGSSDTGTSGKGGDSGNDEDSRYGAPEWMREDTQWIDEMGFPTRTEAQTDRVNKALDRSGLSGDTSGNRFTQDDISVSTSESTELLRQMYSDDLAESPAANLYRKDAEHKFRKRNMADLTRQYSSTSGFDSDTTRSSRSSDFAFPGANTETKRVQVGTKKVKVEDEFETPDVDSPEDDPFGAFSDEDSTEDPDVDPDPEFKEVPEYEMREVGGGNGDGVNEDVASGIGNILDKEFKESPLDENGRSIWNRLFNNEEDASSVFGDYLPEQDVGSFKMPKSGFFEGGGEGGMGILSLLDGDSPFETSGMKKIAAELGGADQFSELLEGSEKFKDSLKALIPSMQKFYQIFALALPVLVSMGVQAAGVATAMGSLAIAGGLVTGLGMLGFGDSLSSSLRESKKRLGTFKEELYDVFSGTFGDFAPFTAQLLTTLPQRMSQLTDPLSQLTVFMDAFNAGIDGSIDVVDKLITKAVALEGPIEQMSLRFGAIIGDGIIDLFEWLIMTGFKNQEMLIALGKAVKNIALGFFNLAMVAAKLLVVFSPIAGVFAFIADVLNNNLLVALGVTIGTVWGLVAAVNALAAVQFSSALAGILAYGTAAVSAFTSAAAAAASYLSAVIPAMTISTGGAALLLVGAGLTAGYLAYNAVAPDGASGGPSQYAGPTGAGGGMGGGGGGQFTGGGVGTGSSKTVINVEGDINRDNIADVEDAIRQSNRIENSRNE